MFNRKTPDTLAVDITYEGQGGKEKVAVVFNNRKDDDINALTEELNAREEAKKDKNWSGVMLFLEIVKSFNGQEPTFDAVSKMESEWPGTVMATYIAYYEARHIAVAKN